MAIFVLCTVFCPLYVCVGGRPGGVERERMRGGGRVEREGAKLGAPILHALFPSLTEARMAAVHIDSIPIFGQIINHRGNAKAMRSTERREAVPNRRTERN